jgi:OOP family OmpA-OmpF porin
MQNTIRAGAALLLLMAATACSTTTIDQQALERTTPQGSSFSQQLARDYLDFSKSESAQYDWLDSSYFARKGRRAVAGEEVPPEDSDAWSRIAESVRPELRAGRTRLVTALNSPAKTSMPQVAARAQVSYDCWVEQQQEGWQVDDIARCRNDFFRYLDQLEAKPVAQAPAPAPVAPPAPPPATPEAYVVFFAFDKSDISPVAASVLDRAVADFKRLGVTRVRIEGFTDRSGPDAYNQALSERRARSVTAYMTRNGIPTSAIMSEGFGETRNRVATPDGERNAENRRAEISFGR